MLLGIDLTLQRMAGNVSLDPKTEQKEGVFSD